MLTKEDLKKYAYFSSLSDESLDVLASKLVPMGVSDGTVIIKQGTPPDHFYFLKEGEVVVKRRNAFGQRAVLNVLSSGQGFGEMALLTCSHRSCSVIAKGNATLLKMHKLDFEETVINDSAFRGMITRSSKNNCDYNALKSSRPFALLEPEKMATLSSKLHEREFAPGQKIIEQGDKGEHYFIIKSGRVAVMKHKDGSDPVRLAELTEGEAFGEEALIRDQKRGASVVALEETVVFALDEKDFNGILKSSFLDFTFPEDVPLDNLGDYVIIDARVPAEYEEEHIEGAINIPLEDLRRKFSELEYGQQYVTYCTNDSRGMAAAFLLGMQGFDARNLRGGLSGWEGNTTVGSDGVHYPSQSHSNQ